MGCKNLLNRRKKTVISYILLSGVMLLSFQNCGKGFQSLNQESNSLNSDLDNGSAMEYAADPALQNQALTIIVSKCASCQVDTSLGLISNLTDIEDLLNRGLIIAGRSGVSPLVAALENKAGLTNVTFTTSEMTKIKDWINSIEMAPALASQSEVEAN